MRQFRIVPLVMAALVVVACGSGAEAPVATSSSVVTALASLDAPPAGIVRVSFGGGATVELRIEACRLDGDAGPTDASAEGAEELVALVASGNGSDGEIGLDIRRYRVGGAAVTITDTVTVTEGDPDAPTRVLVAQRFEVDGLVTDGRDPDAAVPLLAVTASGVRAEGVFAPPGNFAADGGLVAGSLWATCRG